MKARSYSLDVAQVKRLFEIDDLRVEERISPERKEDIRSVICFSSVFAENTWSATALASLCDASRMKTINSRYLPMFNAEICLEALHKGIHGGKSAAFMRQVFVKIVWKDVMRGGCFLLLESSLMVTLQSSVFVVVLAATIVKGTREMDLPTAISIILSITVAMYNIISTTTSLISKLRTLFKLFNACPSSGLCRTGSELVGDETLRLRLLAAILVWMLIASIALSALIFAASSLAMAYVCPYGVFAIDSVPRWSGKFAHCLDLSNFLW